MLGAEVGFFHAHIKGVDFVRRPARGPAAAQCMTARTARSAFLSMHWHGIQERPPHSDVFRSSKHLLLERAAKLSDTSA